MVPREEHPARVQEHLVALRVTRGRDHEEIVGEACRLLTLEAALDGKAGVVAVHHAIAPEVTPELRVVPHVIDVREEHETHAPHLLDAPHEMAGEPRRVHEDIAVRTDDEIARAAVGALRGEAAEMHVAVDALRVCGDRLGQVALSQGADGAGGARDHGLVGPP